MYIWTQSLNIIIWESLITHIIIIRCGGRCYCRVLWGADATKHGIWHNNPVGRSWIHKVLGWDFKSWSYGKLCGFFFCESSLVYWRTHSDSLTHPLIHLTYSYSLAFSFLLNVFLSYRSLLFLILHSMFVYRSARITRCAAAKSASTLPPPYSPNGGSKLAQIFGGSPYGWYFQDHRCNFVLEAEILS